MGGWDAGVVVLVLVLVVLLLPLVPLLVVLLVLVLLRAAATTATHFGPRRVVARHPRREGPRLVGQKGGGLGAGGLERGQLGAQRRRALLQGGLLAPVLGRTAESPCQSAAASAPPPRPRGWRFASLV